MHERFLHGCLLLAAVSAAAFVALRSHERAPSSAVATDPAAAVPPGPGLLITADLARLAQVAAAELLGAGGEKLLGLQATCGFEPLLSVRRVAFATPFRARSPQPGSDFALIAETSLSERALAACAEAVIRKRGGTPVRARVGHFLSVRDAKKPLGEVAIRADGLLVLSGGEYFRDVIDTADGAVTGDQAARLRHELHAGLRRRLGPAELQATLLPGSSSVLGGVRAAGLALQIAEPITLRGFVACASAEICSMAQQTAVQFRAELAQQPGLSRLASAVIAQRDAELELRAELPRRELGRLISALDATEP